MALDIPALLPAYSHNTALATPLFARCVRVHEHVCVCVRMRVGVHSLRVCERASEHLYAF